MSKVVYVLVGAVAAGVVMCAGGLTAVISGAAQAACAIAPSEPTKPTGPTRSDAPALASVTTTTTWSPAEVANATTIVAVGLIEHVPERGRVIALATAMQESHLRNLADLGPRNDHDSLGLFQQRPSLGWGTPAAIMDPAYASSRFYTTLRTVAGWPTMALTEAAQRVQRSATPDAYANWENDARALENSVDALADDVLAGWCAAAALPDDWSLPQDTPYQVLDAIAWTLLQLGTPYHLGGDCTDAHSAVPAHQCDCSSLVQMGYRAGGINMPRTADEQSRHGRPVTGARRPGDLIFLIGADGTRQHPGHVGMNLGGGLVIEAPQTNDTVKVVLLNSSWITTQVAVRRLAH